MKYYEKKIKNVLETIEPICCAFNVKCNYEVHGTTHGFKEVLSLDGQQIGCTSNSIDAVVEEVVAYIFLTRYCTRKKPE